MIFDKHANLKYKFGNRHFWAEGYYVSTVGLNEATIKKYIQEQEKHVRTPFEGRRRVKGNSGLNKVKASVFRRWPVTEAYSLRANRPFDGRS